MTTRLVALMSAVLLISLAVFAWLVARAQDQVMVEVGRTISDVGKATLRTFGRSPRQELAWESLDPPVTAAPGAVVTRVQVLRDAAGTEHGRMVTLESATAAPVVRDERFKVIVSDVRAEQVPVHRGFVLRFPAVGAPHARTPPRVREERVTEVDVARLDALPAREVLARADVGSGGPTDILLPVPTADYQELFTSMRRRFLVVFLVVFVLGTALAASLAARFTRPIRDLDAALRRLSGGDLGVTVAAKGKDEVGRLGRAFNDMAAKLRQSREREREMQRRERLAALGRLAAGVAHDIRNPLHSIGLTLQHLQETSRPTEPDRSVEHDRALALIRGEIRRLDQIVTSFLTFARSERRERAPVDIEEILRETARLVEREAARRRIIVAVEVAPPLPPLHGDGEAIRASVLNLVLNALEAIDGSGRVTLRARREEQAVLVEVEDTGRGIADADRERVFEFAYTTRKDGHGLGLAMVHQVVVEDHEGRVALESCPGAGTVVRLFFPSLPRGGALAEAAP